MKDPKVGERVRIYDIDRVTHEATRDTGVIQDVEGGVIFVACDNWKGDLRVNEISGSWFHPKQCRRLIRRERERIWAFQNAAGEYVAVSTTPPSDPVEKVRAKAHGLGQWREFIEVRKK